MAAKEIYLKTLAFSWVKLGVGVLNMVIAVALFAILISVSGKGRTCSGDFPRLQKRSDTG